MHVPVTVGVQAVNLPVWYVLPTGFSLRAPCRLVCTCMGWESAGVALMKCHRWGLKERTFILS